ncbi:hypothetical protein ACHMW6_23915 [Pseudoduganella sp. UC29_106]|uniref:hypothetical protein n=1 Tax=Pseudoduganella sp. UC29_106 TaxID=3374553 RepID=UPI0037584B8D
MEYQLVLQMRGHSLINFDELISLEDELNLALSDMAGVDGHDMGRDEANIFIITSNPLVAFSRAKPILERRNLLPTINAAFRSLTDETYSNIWPEDSKVEFSVA